MPVQAALDSVCVCERNRSSDCQTPAHCSAAIEGCEGEGGGQERNQEERNQNVQKQKGQVPKTVQNVTAENSESQGTKEGY